MDNSIDNKQSSVFYELLGACLDTCKRFRAPTDTIICVASDGHSTQHMVGGNSISATIALTQCIQAHPELLSIIADAVTLAKAARRVKAPDVPSDGVSENDM